MKKKANFNFVEGTKIPKLPKVTYTDMPNQKAKSWEKRFDKEFRGSIDLPEFIVAKRNKVKSFIHELLAEERKAIKEKFVKLVNNGFQVGEINEMLKYLSGLKTKKKC